MCDLMQGESNGVPTENPVLLREVEHLRPSEGSRPASDTDDMLWEELLQDSDSASTGSSDIGQEEPYSQSHSLPVPTIALTSDEDEDEALPQVGRHFSGKKLFKDLCGFICTLCFFLSLEDIKCTVHLTLSERLLNQGFPNILAHGAHSPIARSNNHIKSLNNHIFFS